MAIQGLGTRSVDLTAESLASYDAALFLTDHAPIDWALVAAHAPRPSSGGPETMIEGGSVRGGWSRFLRLVDTMIVLRRDFLSALV